MVNGQPGIVFEQNGQAITVATFSIENGRIVELYTILNPEKLRLWSSTGAADMTDPPNPSQGE